MDENTSRQYDVMLFGVTGYTGRRVASHIISHYPSDIKWAVACRTSSHSKCEDIVRDLKNLPSVTASTPTVITLEKKLSSEANSELVSLVKQVRVVISCVGPFHLYGEPILAACAESGTHYLDCTGESPWVKEMIQLYDGLAKQNKAIIIPQCGLDSVPADIMVWLLATHSREKLNAGLRDVYNACTKLSGGPSGGTITTFLTLLDSYSVQEVHNSVKPFAQSPIPRGQNAAIPSSLFSHITGIRRIPTLGIVTTFFFGDNDAAIVGRSWGLLDSGNYYGQSFRFVEYLQAKSVLKAFLVHATTIFAAFLLLFKPVRRFLSMVLTKPGHGPSDEDSKHCAVEYHSIGKTDLDKHPAPCVSGRFRYSGDSYTLTGLLLAEAAMVILRDSSENSAFRKLGGGLLTPATLGQSYVDRLRKVDVEMDAWVVPNPVEL